MKRIIITGATSGIGKSLVTLCVSQGYKVIACGRNPEQLNQLHISLDVETRCFDVSDSSATRQHLHDTHGDIYVFNAGVCEYVDSNNIDPKMFQRVFSANVLGVVNCISAVRDQLSAGNQLVIVDSLARLLPFTRSQAYGASKAAVHYLTKSLQVDLASSGIEVQSVSPGFVHTPMTQKNDFTMPMKIGAEQAAKQLLKGIEKRRSSIYFPFVFSLIIRMMAWLPMPLQIKLCQRL
jgi:NAD(P)-dependent dehydrogenase (short-subunit alcohol dehydrogenase family)